MLPFVAQYQPLVSITKKALMTKWNLLQNVCRRFHFFIKASFIIDTKGWYCATKGNICNHYLAKILKNHLKYYFFEKVAHTGRLSCISLCSSILQLLNRVNVLAAIQFRSRGEWRNLPYFAISQAFRHREVQRDCQNRMREIGYMPLENCPYLMTAYFQSLFSMWLWF